MPSLLQPDLILGAALFLVSWRLVGDLRSPRKLLVAAAAENRRARAGMMRKPWPLSCRLARISGSTPDVHRNDLPPEQAGPGNAGQAPSALNR
jgi:hypothetical protein